MTLGWTLLIGAVVGLGLLCATRRRVLTVAVLAAALVTVPFVSEVLKANTSRLQFQGRYDLPTMAGIILIAAGAVDGWVRTTPRLARMAAPAITLAGALQVTELVGVLHRYSVGIQGSYDPLSWYRHWHAPVNTVVLLVVGAAVIAATYLFFGRYEGGLFADLAALPGWSVPADPGPDRPGPPGDAGPPPRPDRASRARPGARRAPGGDRGGTVVDDGAGANGAGPDGGGDGG
jgi:hypothetical protein